MAVPGYLAGGFRYLATAAVSNVATIITDLRAELTANGWTEISTGVFRMPADAFGRYVDLTLTSLSATWLQFKVVDHNSLTVYDGSIYIDSTGTEVRYYTGPDYCYVEALRATVEAAMVFKPNPDPETDDGSCQYPFCAWAYRNAAGTATGSANYSYYYGWPGSTAYSLYDCLSEQQMFASNTVLGGGISRSGAYTFMPCEVLYRYSGTSITYARVQLSESPSVYWIGRMPQVLQSASSIAGGTQITVPIDSGVSGTFQRFQGRSDSFSINILIRVA